MEHIKVYWHGTVLWDFPNVRMFNKYNILFKETLYYKIKLQA